MTDKAIDIEKVTAPGSSVGADGEQALSKNNYEKSIADLHVEGNLQATDFCNFGTFDTSCQKSADRRICRRLQWKNYMIPSTRQRHRLLRGWFMRGHIFLWVRPKWENPSLWHSLVTM